MGTLGDCGERSTCSTAHRVWRARSGWVRSRMSNNNPTPTPDPILQTAFGFWSSKVLLTAVEFGVFTPLANQSMTGAELGRALRLPSRRPVEGGGRLQVGGIFFSRRCETIL